MSDPTNSTPPPLPGSGAPPFFNFGPNADPSLATPWIRLAAGIIDGLVLLPVNYLLMRIFAPSPEAIVAAALKGETLTFGIGTQIICAVITLAAMLAVNYNFLKKGQTIGKLALKLQIQDRSSGGLLPVNDLILRRILPFFGAVLVLTAIHPFLGLLVAADAFMIFRPNRNTLHDDFANTKVVQLPA